MTRVFRRSGVIYSCCYMCQRRSKVSHRGWNSRSGGKQRRHNGSLTAWTDSWPGLWQYPCVWSRAIPAKHTVRINIINETGEPRNASIKRTHIVRCRDSDPVEISQYSLTHANTSTHREDRERTIAVIICLSRIQEK